MDIEKVLNRSDIVKECGMPYYERGKQYYADGAVIQCKITSEGALFTQLNAAVEGTANAPYKQNIRITWRPGFKSAEIEGTCSCPIGFNCKHIAAVCLAYQDGNQKGERKRQEAGCLDWLDNLNRQAKPASVENNEFLAYLLKPVPNQHEPIVELIVTKTKKYGGLSKGRKVNLQSLRYGYSHYGFVTAEDGEIVKLIAALDTTFSAQPFIAGALGAVTLNKLLKTGRLFWEDIDTPPLTLGESRDLTFDWRLTESGEYQLQTQLKPTALPILVDPPHYIDPDERTLGTLSKPSYGYQQLKAVLSAPPVPERVADEFSYRLTVEYPDLDLPPPKKIDLKEIGGIEPVPHLILYGEQTTARQYAHYLSAGFKYGSWLLPGRDIKEYSVINSAQGLVRIKRMPEREKAVIARLSELGFTPAPEADSTGVKDLILGSYAKSSLESASRWGHFLESIVPELDRDGWQIEFRDSFLLNFQAVDTWDAEISDSRNDWFEMRFNIELDGQPVPLLPLIMPVLENYDLNHLPELLNIPAGDHRYLTVPSEKIKPFLAILLELFGGSTFDKNGTLKISRFNAASLADMELHSYGLFSIKGGEELKKLAQKLSNFKGIDDVPVPANLKATLREYQKAGLNWLQFLREYSFAGILADDMGLGKTVQTLAHLLLEKQSGRMKEPSLIIAPTSLLSNWRRESERFTPDLNMLILQGTERKQLFYKMRDYDVIMTTYPLLPRDEETLLEHQYHYLILDEAQIIKNPLSKGAQIVRQIKSRHRLSLTGTPMENHLGELWAQFDFLMPGFLGDNATFKKLYRTPIETFGNAEQKTRLSKRIAPFMLRRTKQEVAAELPAKTEIIRSVPLYEKQAALYESIRLTMEKKVRDAIAERGLSRSHITILDALLKLRQTCCDPRTLNLEAAHKINESAKLDLLMELLPELLEESRKILVFSQFTRMIALIEDKLNQQGIAYSKLTGQTKDRDSAIDMFKNGEVDVFLISLKAGGIGLNLTEADTVIIYDPWWNPAVENQAADRAHRIGQDKPVFVYKLITENTVEEKMLAMQDRKRALANGIYNEGAKEEALQLTADDLTALFQPLA